MTLRENLDILEHRYCIEGDEAVDEAINDLIKLAIKDAFEAGIKFTFTGETSNV